jgi:hypothetical protein
MTLNLSEIKLPRLEYRKTPLKLPWAITSSPLGVSIPCDIKKTSILYFKSFKTKVKIFKKKFIRLFRLVNHSGLLGYKIKILLG